MKTSNDKLTEFTAFISMPFDKFFDDLYEDGIKGINNHLKDYHIKIVRLDKKAYQKKRIEENVLAHIDVADILIADISRYPKSATPNVSVMHEVGYAAGRRIPVVLIGSEESHKNLPSNLQGTIVTTYNNKDSDYSNFSRKLAKQVNETIYQQVVGRLKGDYPVEGFTGRNNVHLPRLIAAAKRRVLILTTNLSYTVLHLIPSLKTSIEENKENPDFKVEILTMDPESNVANDRAEQLGKTTREYRDELRESLEKIIEVFSNHKHVEIMTYTTLPTQMTFVVDNVVVVAVVSMSELSRESTHFVVGDSPQATEPFVGHFKVVRTHRNKNHH